MDVYNNSLARARVDELMHLNKAGLIARARHHRPDVHTQALERWRKIELAWTIARAELEDSPDEA